MENRRETAKNIVDWVYNHRSLSESDTVRGLAEYLDRELPRQETGLTDSEGHVIIKVRPDGVVVMGYDYDRWKTAAILRAAATHAESKLKFGLGDPSLADREEAS